VHRHAAEGAAVGRSRVGVTVQGQRDRRPAGDGGAVDDLAERAPPISTTV
jgi:hypothetical protein